MIKTKKDKDLFEALFYWQTHMMYSLMETTSTLLRNTGPRGHSESVMSPGS